MSLPNLTAERLAQSRSGRLVLCLAAGGLTLQAVRALRQVVQIASALDDPPPRPFRAPCADCAGKRAATIDVDGPAEPPAGDPASPPEL